ncbi:MAG: flagellar export protein FliJ [Candidatus Polarisedimenticolaceae bacterium]|nr:flagellar export protein FliJ [Candidatus Polarisedimenticolaceae bacterium]
MSPSKRFKPVLRVAESNERNAAHQFGDSQRYMQKQQARLDELREYHDEYLERFNTASRNGISAAQLREYQAFLAKLDLAIKEQEGVVQASDKNQTEKKELWQQKHIRSKVLDNVMQRYQAEEQRAMEKREQKEADERSQRRHPSRES